MNIPGWMWITIVVAAFVSGLSTGLTFAGIGLSPSASLYSMCGVVGLVITARICGKRLAGTGAPRETHEGNATTRR